MKKIEAILLDGDGVTIRPPRMFSEILAERLGVPPEDVVEFFIEEFGACKVGQADVKEKLGPYLDRWGWQGTVEEVLELWFESERYPNEAVLAQAAELRERGTTVGLVSNQESNRAAFVRDRMGFAEAFDRTYFSCDIGHPKPSAEFWQHVTEDLGLEPEQVLVIDDEAETVESAREFGFRAELYEPSRSLASYLA